jgi:hypothetical protein
VVNSFIFIIFYFFTYLIGRGFTLLFLKLHKSKVSSFQVDKYSHFFPLIGLFIFGEIKLIFNFFTELNFYIFIVALIGFSSNKLLLSFNKESIGIQSVIAFVVGISSNTINFSYDAGLYHLNSQSWLNQSKIVFGLVNLHSRYGYSSFIEYINSNTWIFNNFIFQHFTNLIFIVSFFIFLYKCLFNDNLNNYKIASLTVVAFGVLDNFGVSGGRNGFIDIEAVSKQDTPFAIIFFLLLVYIIFYIRNKDEEKHVNFFIVLFLFLFSVQLRVFALSITPIILFFFIKEFFINKKSFRYKLITFYLVLLGAIWVIKNYVISSCLFYPISFTCIPNTTWFNKNNAITETIELRNFHRALDLENSTMVGWFNMWSQKPINYTVFLNFIISFLIILIFTLLFTNKRGGRFYFIRFLMPLYLFSIWSISSPGIRMGLVIFLISVFYIGTERDELNNFFDKKYLLNLLFFSSLILLPRLDNYKDLINNPLEITQLQPPEIEYFSQKETIFWGVRAKGDQCWINLECVPGPVSIEETLISTYRVFKKIDE